MIFQRSADDTTLIYDPSLIAVNTNNTWHIKGPYSWYSNEYGPVYNENYTINLYPHAVFSLGGPLQLKRLSPNGGKTPLTDTGDDGIDMDTFIVDLYVANTDKDFNGSQLKPNGKYSITEGDFGAFTVAIASPGSDIYNNHTGITNLPIIGLPPNSTSPYLGNGSGSVEFHPERYLFTILDNHPFSIDQVLTTGQAAIARFKIILTDVNPLSTVTSYGVHVKFSNSLHSTQFSMHRNSIPTDYAIDYSLSFLGEDVIGETSILWDGFIGNNTTYEQNVYITNIDSSDVHEVPSGTYMDVIYGTITPKDHL